MRASKKLRSTDTQSPLLPDGAMRLTAGASGKLEPKWLRSYIHDIHDNPFFYNNQHLLIGEPEEHDGKIGGE